MNESSGFELEETPAPEPKPDAPTPRQPAAAAPAKAPADESLLSARRKARLLRFVPGFAVGFLLVAWICLGPHAWPFALTGAAAGAWAAWQRRSEVLVGTVAAVAGLATFFAVAGFTPGMGMGIVMIGCGIVGFLAGLDDRFRGSGA